VKEGYGRSSPRQSPRLAGSAVRALRLFRTTRATRRSVQWALVRTRAAPLAYGEHGDAVGAIDLTRHDAGVSDGVRGQGAIAARR